MASVPLAICEATLRSSRSGSVWRLSQWVQIFCSACAVQRCPPAALFGFGRAVREVRDARPARARGLYETHWIITWRGQPEKPPRPAGGKADGPLGFAEDALDLADGDPVDLGNLGIRHSVLHPRADTVKLRPRDFRRHLPLGADRRFAPHMDRGRRCDCQHARLPRR